MRLRLALCAMMGAWLVGCSSDSSDPAEDGDGDGAGPTELPVDCGNKQNTKDPRCAQLIDLPPAGTVGTGLALVSDLGGASMENGFVDPATNRLVVAMETGVGSRAGPRNAIFTIDLSTGDRTFVSGKWGDAKSGIVTAGTGPEFADIKGVTPGPDGWYVMDRVALRVGTQYLLYRVNPQNGERTLYWDSKAPGQECPLDTKDTPTTSAFVTQLNEEASIVSRNGTFYVMYHGNGRHAIYGIKGTPAKCEPVMYRGGAAEFNRGTGPDIDAAFQWPTFAPDGTLYVMTIVSIYSVDLATGNMQRVASEDRHVGTGQHWGESGMAFSGEELWTLGVGESEFPGKKPIAILQVNRQTGDRGKALIGNDFGIGGHCCPNKRVFVRHPTKALFIVGFEDKVMLFEPSTLKSNLLSY